MAGRPPTPADWTELSERWLEGALRDSALLPRGRAITAVRREPGAGGIAVCGRVARLVIESEPRPPGGGPIRLFAKLRNPAWEGDPRVYRQEVRFYRELAPVFPHAVPRCHYADFDEASGNFVLLLEDLTEVSPGHRLEGCDFASSRRLLEEVGRIHGSWWGGTALTASGWERNEPSPAQLERWLSRFRAEWGSFPGERPYSVDDALRTTVMRISDEAFLRSGRQLTNAPVTWVHRDLHVENVLFDTRSGATRVWIIDWQESGLGHPARDVAHILAADTIASVRRERGEELLDAYREALRERGISYDAASLGEDVRSALRWLFLFQVLFLNEYEATNPHDLRTLEREWSRISAAFLDLEHDGPG